MQVGLGIHELWSDRNIWLDYIYVFKVVIYVCPIIYIYIYLACLFYPINVKTAEPIVPNLFAGPRVTSGFGDGWSNFQKFPSKKTQFLKILKIHEFFFVNPRFFCFAFVLQCIVVYTANMFTIKA